MTPAQRARQGYLLQQGHNVWKNAWWVADCPAHGPTPHLGYLGGRCQKCQDEGLEAAGLLERKPFVRNFAFKVEVGKP